MDCDPSPWRPARPGSRLRHEQLAAGIGTQRSAVPETATDAGARVLHRPAPRTAQRSLQAMLARSASPSYAANAAACAPSPGAGGSAGRSSPAAMDVSPLPRAARFARIARPTPHTLRPAATSLAAWPHPVAGQALPAFSPGTPSKKRSTLETASRPRWTSRGGGDAASSTASPPFPSGCSRVTGSSSGSTAGSGGEHYGRGPADHAESVGEDVAGPALQPSMSPELGALPLPCSHSPRLKRGRLALVRQCEREGASTAQLPLSPLPHGAHDGTLLAHARPATPALVTRSCAGALLGGAHASRPAPEYLGEACHHDPSAASVLPTVASGEHPDLHMISPSTVRATPARACLRLPSHCAPLRQLRALLDGQYATTFERVELVDCRFDYEYAGGHVRGALNMCSQEHMEQHFFSQPPSAGKRVAVVFHCEFSQARAPAMYISAFAIAARAPTHTPAVPAVPALPMWTIAYRRPGAGSCERWIGGRTQARGLHCSIPTYSWCTEATSTCLRHCRYALQCRAPHPHGARAHGCAGHAGAMRA